MKGVTHMSLVNIYITSDEKKLDAILLSLTQLRTTMADNQVQLESTLTSLNSQVNKIFDEVTNLKVFLEQRVLELEAMVLNGEITGNAQFALDTLKASLQRVDDIVPDAVV